MCQSIYVARKSMKWDVVQMEILKVGTDRKCPSLTWERKLRVDKFIQQKMLRPRSSNGPLNKILLQASNLLLEGLHLFPAVQWPSVMCP